MHAQKQVVLHGITTEDIQKIFEKTLAEIYPRIPAWLYVDVNYLYTFDVSDIAFIGKFTDSMRLSQRGHRNPMQIEWHRMLERWYNGQTVTIYDKPIKPLQIERTIDRVVNELMHYIALAIAGENNVPVMKFHAIGDGALAGSVASPGNTQLVNELDRIDVTEQPGGGGLSVDGSTFMCVGNHDRFAPTGNYTEMGIFNRELPGSGEPDVPVIDDIMGDHSIFPAAVPHTHGDDALGGTVIVFQTSS